MVWIFVIIAAVLCIVFCIVFGLTLGAFAFDDYKEGESIFTTIFRYFMAFIGMPIIALLVVVFAPIVQVLHLALHSVYSVFGTIKKDKTA